jgi:hypothetical protein
VILGDAGRVRTELGRDPGLATQADTRTGWAPLHAARASRWHRLDPARAEGLLAVARMLLDAGADPNRYADDADPLSPVIYAAIRSGCSAELTGLLLGYGADPHIPGPDGRSPYVLAVTQGRTGLAMLLRQHGADVTVTGTDRLLAACQDADRAKVERLLAADPGLPGRIPAAQQAAAMIHAAESGNTAAITLLLDLGLPR